MYYTAYDFTHAGFEPETRYKGGVSRLVQRLDGFFSVDAGFEHGELTTVPLTFTGRRLELNLDTGALGSACVELQDEDGRPGGRILPGSLRPDPHQLDRPDRHVAGFPGARAGWRDGWYG